ncbi:hypothetical protein KC333_g5531 [Hortaea werneckii]|nr:hypothetical protein KC333_g5531 [Hortaea werneckii]KAI7318705.1 hypothetical protein KC326_g3473 [Hortaea werneckii]
MPSIDATIAWAVPVQVEVLGAHLEAYVNLQPTINTLRLCHRFGKGDQAAITKLPVELLSEVEDILMAEERRKTREEWETDFRCFQLHCEPYEHFDAGEIKEVKRKLKREALRTWASGCEWKKAYKDFLEQDLYDYIEENFQDAHWDRHNRWRVRVGAPGSPMHIFLNLQANYFEQQFGLAIWTSHVSVNPPDWNCFGHDTEGQTTVAYLILPSQQQRFAHSRPHNEHSYGFPEGDVEMGYGVRFQAAKALTESDVRRFKRAMDILSLQPRVHESQLAAWNHGRDEDEEVLVDCKPQLTVLLRSSSE